MADMLLLSDQLGIAERTQAENIKLASQNLLSLIGDILDISKIRVGKQMCIRDRSHPVPASRRVSLKDREERELNVRRALGAFITQPGEAQAAAGADTEEASVSKGTDVSFVTDDIWDTDYKGCLLYTSRCV